MGNRPQTLYAIADSPVGLAAWMLDHDARSYDLIARVFAGQPEGLTRDDILDNVTLYWLTNTAVSSARLYWESKLAFFAPKGVTLPVGVSVFPDELYAAPRSWAEHAYPNLIHSTGCRKAGTSRRGSSRSCSLKRSAPRSARCADRRRPMLSKLPTFTPTRRRAPRERGHDDACRPPGHDRLGTSPQCEGVHDDSTTARSAAQDTAAAAIRPFQVEVPQADLDDLRQRLAATRLPSKELVADRSQGVQLATIQELTRYWTEEHDWRTIEANAQRAARSSRPRSTGSTSTSSTSSRRTRTPCR